MDELRKEIRKLLWDSFVSARMKTLRKHDKVKKSKVIRKQWDDEEVEEETPPEDWGGYQCPNCGGYTAKRLGRNVIGYDEDGNPIEGNMWFYRCERCKHSWWE